MIEIVPEIPSTNGALVARLVGGEAIPEGHWLIADRQSAGRGRAGRAWSDGAGNFMGSTVVQLHGGDLEPAHPLPQTLALVAGLAVHQAVTEILGEDDRLRIKWPNDLLVGEAKLGGILLERQGDAVVVGIGVNLAQSPVLPDRPTISLSALGRTVARDGFATSLSARWQDALARWHHGEWSALRSEWTARALAPGTLLTVNDPVHGPVIGAYAGIDSDGVALLRLADGARRAIHAGDLDLVRG